MPRMTEAKRQRLERVHRHAMNGLTDKEIADREGYDATNITPLVRDIERPAKRKSYNIAYGLTKDSRLFRTRLGAKLSEVIEAHGAEKTASLVGIGNKAQTKATVSPVTHDWTTAQMERLARAVKMSFVDLMIYCSREGLV